MKFIEARSVRIAAESFGAPSDPAVVLVMGATASMLWWPDALCRTLADAGRFVIRFDHRDTGRSTSVPLGEARYTITDMADDVLAVMDGFAIDRAHLVGMSLGGLLVQLLTLRNPPRVLSITLIAAEPLGGEPVDAPPIAPAFMDHFASMGSLDWSDAAAVAAFKMEVARLSAPSPRGMDETETRRLTTAEIEHAPDQSSAFNHGSLSGDELDSWDLRRIDRRTLVIHGAHDPIVAPANGRAIADQVAGARLIVLPHAGHELHSEDLPGIAAAIVAHTAAA